MRIRARHIHLIETLIDNILGYLINFLMVAVIWNGIFDYNITLFDNALGGLLFFVVGWVRKYYVRRTSSNFIKKLYEKYQDDAELQEQTGKS